MHSYFKLANLGNREHVGTAFTETHTLEHLKRMSYTKPGADPGFPGWGASPKEGNANLLFCQIFIKTAWKWRILSPRWEEGRPKFYYVNPSLETIDDFILGLLELQVKWTQMGCIATNVWKLSLMITCSCQWESLQKVTRGVSRIPP